MKEMTVPITSVRASCSFRDDGQRRVLGTFSPVHGTGSLDQNSGLCGTEEIKSNVDPSLGILPLPQGCPRIPMTTYAVGAQSRRCLGISGSLWGPLHRAVRPPETGTAAHEDLVLGPAPEEGEIWKDAGYAISAEAFTQMHSSGSIPT